MGLAGLARRNLATPFYAARKRGFMEGRFVFGRFANCPYRLWDGRKVMAAPSVQGCGIPALASIRTERDRGRPTTLV
jgi:hypothetical protein